MKLILEMDDFSCRNSNLGLLEDLKDHFVGFKVTLFTVPWDIRWGEPTPITQEQYLPFVKATKKAIKDGWMEIALHGLTHLPMEFAEISYESAKKRIILAEKMFINRGIDYVKIFKAPHWDLSKGAKRALKELGFWFVEDGYYNWNLADAFPQELAKKGKTIIAHGHIQQVCENGLEEVMPKLLALPAKDVKWLFLSEYLKANKVYSEKLLEELKKI